MNYFLKMAKNIYNITDATITKKINEATDGLSIKEKRIYFFYFVLLNCGILGFMFSLIVMRYEALAFFGGMMAIAEIGSRTLIKGVKK